MWPFKSTQRLQDSKLFKDFTDWHCHILPGVDDGVQSMEEATALLTKYEQLGIKEVWLTPHIMEDIPNTTEELREKYNRLINRYRGKVTLYLGSENMLDNLFNERLENNDLLPVGKNKDYLLVETSYYNPPMDLFGTMETIQRKGYHPILAHPERYVYMTKKDYRRLKEMGVKFQLNLSTIAGLYGVPVQASAMILMKEGFYDYKGTDTHTFGSFQRIIKSEMKKNDIRKLLSI